MTEPLPFTHYRRSTSLFCFLISGLLTLIIFPDALSAQPVQFYQGFENSSSDNWNYQAYPGAYSPPGGPSVNIPATVWAPIYALNGAFSAPTGTRMWASSDYFSSSYHYLDFDPVPVQNLTNAVLSFKYITFLLDPWDEIEYCVQFDNGSSWSGYNYLSLNNQYWETVTIPIPANADYVRLRLRTRQVTGVVCAGYDDIQICGYVNNNQTITTGQVGTRFCLNNAPISISVPFSSQGYFPNGNQFIAQLSDRYGNFANPVTLGSLSAFGNNPSGTISGSLPSGLTAGTQYRVRVISTQPQQIIGTDNGTNITLGDLDFSLSAPTYPSGHHVSCAGANDGSINLTIHQGTPPYTYQWSGPGGYQANAEDISQLVPGNYLVTVSDAAGCSISKNLAITGPQLNATVIRNHITCHGQNDGSISLNIVGDSPPFTVNWTGPGSFTATSQNLTQLAGGTYTATITDVNGCSIQRSATIQDPAPLNLAISSPVGNCGFNISCFGAHDGEINSVPTGGVTPYSFSWTGPGGYTSTQNSPTNLGPGTYVVTLTDINGCTVNKSITLSEGVPLEASISTDLNACGFAVTCANGNDGLIRIDTVLGGCPPYSYHWSNGATGNAIQNLSAGNYWVVISDVNGCTVTESLELTAPAPLKLNATLQDPPCESDQSGSITLAPSGGCPLYTYQWTGPGGFTANTASLQQLGEGAYTVTLQDAQGCNLTETLVLEGADPPSANLGCAEDTLICAGDSVTLSVDLIGVAPWSLSYAVNGIPTVVTVNQSPYYLTLAPGSTSRVELLGVGNFCGEGPVCGSATIAVKDCNLDPSNVCLSSCFSSELLSINQNGNCATYSMRIRSDGTCNRELSNLTLSIPCGTFSAGSTNRGWLVSATSSSGDPNSGLVGLKVDNIQGFGSTRDSFLLTYTVCDPSGCGPGLRHPLIAYKAGTCVHYENGPQAQAQAPVAQRIDLQTYPNPGNGPVHLQVTSSMEGLAWMRIIDLRTSQQLERKNLGYLQPGNHKFTWEGKTDTGLPVPGGIYLVEFGVGDQRTTQKLIRF